MERSLIANNQYAKAKYQDLKPKIEGMKKGGKTFEDCPQCGTNATEVEEEAPRLILRHCMVCFHSEKQIRIDCPDCGNSGQYIDPHESFVCKQCDCEVSGDSGIFNLLDQNTIHGTKDDFDSATPANCDECQGYHTVCDYEGGYLCTNCFAYFDSVSQCQWCNDPMTGETEYSYATGCEHCDGLAGHHADD